MLTPVYLFLRSLFRGPRNSIYIWRPGPSCGIYDGEKLVCYQATPPAARYEYPATWLYRKNMDQPKIVGFPPKSSIKKSGFPWFSPSILGYYHFRKPPYIASGFNPFEKYARQVGSFPQGSEAKIKKYLSCHHLVFYGYISPLFTLPHRIHIWYMVHLLSYTFIWVDVYGKCIVTYASLTDPMGYNCNDIRPYSSSFFLV